MRLMDGAASNDVSEGGLFHACARADPMRVIEAVDSTGYTTRVDDVPEDDSIRKLFSGFAVMSTMLASRIEFIDSTSPE